MTGPLVLGLDVGTSSTKALVLDGRGTVVECRRVAHRLVATAGAVEAEPEGWWDAAVAAIGALETPPGRLAAVGLSGNMSSVVLLEGDGSTWRPAPLLADPRGARQLAALDPALRADVEAAGGNALAPALSLASLLWLRDEEPEALARAAAWVSAKDHVRLRLTGAIATEPTDAANSVLVDVRTRAWRLDLAERLGLPPRLFPPLGDARAVGGRVTAAAAAAAGLAEGTPVAYGCGDMAAAAIGSGAVEPGTAVVSLGTSTTVIVPLGDGPPDPAWHGRLSYHPLPGPRAGFALASLLTGGLALDWLRAVTGGRLPLPAEVLPDPEDPLVFVPQLSGSGTPDFEPALRGTLLGLNPHTGPAELAGALFEAIAFEVAGALALLDHRPVDAIRVTGGGANVAAWVQVLADVLDRPVEVLEHAEVSAVGAALLAREALGAPLPAAAVVRVARRCAPRRGVGPAWRARAARYAAARTLALDYHRSQHAGGPLP